MNIKELAEYYSLDVSGYWVWIGQNTTTGTPNSKTGKMSLCGDFKHFDTKAERDNFYDNYSDISRKAYKCTVNTGRKFKLGCSVVDYLEWLAMIRSGYVNS